MCLLLAAVSLLVSLFLHPNPVFAATQTTVIVFDQVKDTYQVGDKLKATIRVSAPDGSYLTKAYCGFGYNASTMKKLTETDTQDHIWLESETPVKWLSGDIEFEMRTDGKMYFIAGAYSGDGVIEAYRADGSKIECPRASVVYKIGTGIYTATSDCNLSDCVITNLATGEPISFNRDFDTNITEYWGEVAPSCEEISIQAYAENQEDTIILPESMNLAAGENEIKVGVQAVSGETKDYIFHITRPTEAAIVKDIILKDKDGNVIPYNFDPTVYSYDIEVDEYCDTVNFEAVTEGNTKAEYPATSGLQPGYSSKQVIARTSSEEKTYEFYIHRKLSSLSLSSLVIETSDEAVYPMEPAFDPEITDYTIKVPSDVNKAKVTYTIANESDYLKDEVNDVELIHGTNDINLVVTDGINEKNYTVHMVRDERVVFTQAAEEETFTPPRNHSEHVGFNYINLFFIAVIGMILIAAVVGVIALMTLRSKKDYDESLEAVSAKQERNRKKRLKAIEDNKKKEEKKRKDR